jgi:hypothetical protein
MPPIFSSTFLSPSDDISPFDSSSSTIPLGPGMTGLRSAENGEAAAVTRSERMDEDRGRVRAAGEGGEDMVLEGGDLWIQNVIRIDERDRTVVSRESQSAT